MNIIKQTSSELVVQQKPGTFLIVFIVIWTYFFAVNPLFMSIPIFLGIGTTSLTCVRDSKQQINCTEQKFILLGILPQPPTELKQVTAAKVNENKRWQNKQQVKDYSLVLVTKKQEVLIFDHLMRTSFPSNPARLQTVANQINQFIKSKSASVVLKQEIKDIWMDFIPILFLLLFPTIGITLLFLILQENTYSFDLPTQTITHQRKTLIGTSIQKYFFNELNGLELSKYHSKSGTFYRLQLRVHNTKTLTLGDTKNLQEIRHDGQFISDFLKISLFDYIE